MNELCRQSDPRPPRVKAKLRPRISSRMYRADFFCWKTRSHVFVFGGAGIRYAYNHFANALRETWGNDERLRSHDVALSQQLQGGHLAGGVHWTGEENEWQEMDYNYDDSSEWYDIEGHDDES